MGQFYAPAAVEKAPRFIQYPERQNKPDLRPQTHVALVKLRAPQTLSDDIIDGIGRTLSQLARLGLISVVVVDCNNANEQELPTRKADQEWRNMEREQANRLIKAIDASGEIGSRLVDNVIGISEDTVTGKEAKAHITFQELLMTPLRRGIIPIVSAVGYTEVTQTAVPVAAGDVVLALCRELAGHSENAKQGQTRNLRNEVSLDRLIILDPLGGIPTSTRPNGHHVFLNMEQEFEPAKQDLLQGLLSTHEPSALQSKAIQTHATDIGASNPFSSFVESEFNSPKPDIDTIQSSVQHISHTANWNHLRNLELVRLVLSMLPSSSSALLTTPEEAANSGQDVPFQAARVGTRRQRNPLIHNLLTDKPSYSSSLPVSRLFSGSRNEPKLTTKSNVPTTFAKHGMSVMLLPDPRISLWAPPVPGQPHLSLTDSRIDLPRLVHLIEDSFGRTLDVDDYLKRVNNRIAGIIICGEYEGGAILTWETPPGVPGDGSPESRARMVPYLDKFAVLKRSQGSGGVADLIFKAMVRTCFPDGVVWRSRKNNPVNKWYFERSRGTWKLPEEGWTMFWTTPDLSMDKQLFSDYEGVCRQIQPSWADNKAVLD